MESTALSVLLGTAAIVGVLHTLAGPDHYLPFLAMARAGRWSLSKTVGVTVLCGCGHVLSSIILGAIGIALGLAATTLQWIEGARASLAGWLLLGFGLAYAVWGFHRAMRNRPHAHVHVHADGTVHSHAHGHTGEHGHVHGEGAVSLTPWILFTIFVFGPCEPLIPMLMYPAAKMSLWGVILVAVVFAAATLATMTGIVVLCCVGARAIPSLGTRRYGPAIAGLAVAACGLAVTFGL